MRGLIQLLPFFVLVLVVVSVARNALRMARQVSQPPPTPRAPDGYEPEVAERTRRIQEEIRRKIAERRGTTVASQAPQAEPMAEPPAVYEEPPVEPAYTATTAAVLERQQKLADQMRALELARATEQRRAAAVSAVNRLETNRAAAAVATRDGLLADLRDPQSLRQAFLLREVLGPPVGLR